MKLPKIDPRIARAMPWIDIGCFVLAAIGLAFIFLGLQAADSARLNIGIAVTAIAMPAGIAAQILGWLLNRRAD